MSLPYIDNDMTYDYESHRYILTKEYVQSKMGVDLEARYKYQGAVNAILDKASNIVYDYIHQFNNQKVQDYVIAKTESGRLLVKLAMREQIYDMLLNGIFDNGATEEERAMWISQGAKRKLDNTVIEELGTVITYAGVMRFCSPDTTEW